MKVDPEVWLLATAGAALMATGGAFLRSAFAGPRAAEPPPTTGYEPPAPAVQPAAPSAQTEAEMAALREELTLANSTKEAQRIEMVEQRQRSERQVQGAQAEIQRLSEELEAEKSRVAGIGLDDEGAAHEARRHRRRAPAFQSSRQRPQSAGHAAERGDRSSEETQDGHRGARRRPLQGRSTGATGRRGARPFARADRRVEDAERAVGPSTC